MAKIYKSGEWAKSGRVLPGKRKAPKKIDQVLKDGSVIQTQSDQIFRRNKFKEIFKKLFPEIAEENGHLFLKKINSNGRDAIFYIRNIYHLGGDWSSEKKRIEIGKDFLPFFEENERRGVKTILTGCYHYFPEGENGVLLFVCFSTQTYASRNLNNSAAHIHTLDLLNALKNGVYRRLDKSKNELLVLDEKNFVSHINSIRTGSELESVQTEKQILQYFDALYKTLPKKLYGKKCYEQMFAANDQNKNQGAWEGFYIEFFVKKYLEQNPAQNIEWWSSKKKGDLDFDLRFKSEKWFYGDIKSDNEKREIQGNKKENIDFLVQEKNGKLWYVVFEFSSEKDCDHNFETTKWWNRHLQKNDLMSYHTRMKYAIKIEALNIYEITRSSYKYLEPYFPPPVKGKPRSQKLKIPNKMKEFLRIYECK